MTTPSELPTQPPATGPARKSRRWLFVVIGVVIAVIVAGSVLAYEYEPGNALNPYHVYVTQVVWAWQSNDTLIATSAGFDHLAGQTVWLGVALWCSSFLGFSETCSSGNVAIATPGFGLISTNTPFSWSSGSSGASAAITIHVRLPSGSYSGELDIWVI